MDSADKSAFYICVISRNKMARLGKGYSNNREKIVPATNVPYRNILRDPMVPMYFPNKGENTMVVINTEP